jgi:hypothetical protein
MTGSFNNFFSKFNCPGNDFESVMNSTSRFLNEQFSSDPAELSTISAITSKTFILISCFLENHLFYCMISNFNKTTLKQIIQKQQLIMSP